MKTAICLIAALVFSAIGHAQTKPSDFTSGKHIHSKLKGNVNGEWVCKDCNDSLRIIIKKSTFRIKQGVFNVTFDDLIITITKFVLNGKDISDQFNIPMELILSADDYKKFVGRYRDPVTKTNIIPSLKQESMGRFSLTVSFPEMDVTSDQTKGTIFPRTAEFIR